MNNCFPFQQLYKALFRLGRLSIILFFVIQRQCTAQPFYKGADISFLQQIESSGTFFKENGTPKDIFEIFKNHGINAIRLRIWYAPPDGWNSLSKTLIMAKRIKAAGFSFLLDFHYADTWADPGKQPKPAAWQSVTLPALQDSVYAYTKLVINALTAQGTPPQLVQIGNEITNGMLWPEGQLYNTSNPAQQWINFANLVKAGIRAVRDTRPPDSTKIMIHIDRGGDYNGASWFFTNLLNQGVDPDYFGLSYYPWWHGSFTALAENLVTLAKGYGKKIIIAETAYPWTLSGNDVTGNFVTSPSQLLANYPATPQGQLAYMKDLMALLHNLPDGLGAGVFYWEPDWIACSTLGSAGENLAYFDFSNNALPVLSAFESASKVSAGDKKTVSFSLEQNYPNPFNPSTNITYRISSSSEVKLAVFDMLGRPVCTLVNKQQPAGTYTASFDGTGLPSGTYFYTLQNGNNRLTKAMALVK
jgi:arabinogalactan endo-1,4-beta-galactosidase